MRYGELRRALQMVVIAGLPSAGCEVITGEEQCFEIERREIDLVSPADPPLELKIQSCRLDVEACTALCRMAMERANLSGSLTDCEVRFEGNVSHLDITYSYATGNAGCPVDGRRPPGLAAPGRPDARTLAGAWLAHAAWLEAASIHAFVRLARELEDHGAPAALVRGALAAARDEVRHTTLMTALAARYGARPAVPVVTPPGARSLEELAIENAIEGCVRETWGAVIALWQSNVVRDPALRAAFAEIARDEARHAALAWSIDRWIATRLDADARARVTLARRAAAHELIEGDVAQAAELVAVLGLPDPMQMRALLVRSNDALWTGGLS